MSSLIVVCPHCLTWAEPHSERCTECGLAIDMDAPDPDEHELLQRLGEPVADLGPIRIDRLGWPDFGHLLATSEGLMFLPQFSVRPNGALEPMTVDHPTSTARKIHRGSWWWPNRSRATSSGESAASDDTIAQEASTVQRLFDSPGALFVARSSIQKVQVNWTHIRIDRRPARSVTLRSVPSGLSLHDLLKRLRELAY